LNFVFQNRQPLHDNELDNELTIINILRDETVHTVQRKSTFSDKSQTKLTYANKIHVYTKDTDYVISLNYRVCFFCLIINKSYLMFNELQCNANEGQNIHAGLLYDSLI
jgi:hypothetical protein